jgi:PBP1b-binding outer membrane lipoprotein LpoB
MKPMIFILFVLSMISACATKDAAVDSVVVPTEAEGAVVAPVDVGAVEQKTNVAPVDTVASLSAEVDKLQRRLITYIEPLSAKQEKEVEALKEKIHQKETKKASLELKQMLEDFKGVEDESEDSESGEEESSPALEL